MSDIKQVQIFNDQTKNAAFLKGAKLIIGRRVLAGASNVNNISLQNRAVIHHSQAIMKAAIAELNTNKSNQSLSDILSNHIKKLIPNKKEAYTYEDDVIAVTFARTVINKSKLDSQARTALMDKIKAKYPKYDNPTIIDKINATHDALEEVKAFKRDLPYEMILQITKDAFPLNRLIREVPADKLEEVATKLGIHHELQFKALAKMRDMAHDEDDEVTLKEGRDFFDRQYGKTQAEQFKAFVNTFGKMPTEILADPYIKKAFVDQAFIDTWHKIATSDTNKTTYMNLSRAYLYRLPRNIGRLINLKTLSLQENKLKSLPSEIGQLKNLKTLYLGKEDVHSYSHDQNHINFLPAAFGQLINLTHLGLAYNSLISLPPEFGQLINLTHLDLAGNKLLSLPDEFGQLKNLTELSLIRNELTSLPANFKNLTKLEKLDLSWNHFSSSSIPEDIRPLINLTYLNLSGHGFQFLSEWIGELTKLTVLTMTSNRVVSIPDEIGELTKLTGLFLSNNQLINLPNKALKKLTVLKTLDLSYNKLGLIPARIVELINLTDLYIASNGFHRLPAEISKLTNLEKLEFSFNPIKSVPNGCFKDLKNLTHLFISGKIELKDSGIRSETIIHKDGEF